MSDIDINVTVTIQPSFLILHEQSPN